MINIRHLNPQVCALEHITSQVDHDRRQRNRWPTTIMARSTGLFVRHESAVIVVQSQHSLRMRMGGRAQQLDMLTFVRSATCACIFHRAVALTLATNNTIYIELNCYYLLEAHQWPWRGDARSTEYFNKFYWSSQAPIKTIKYDHFEPLSKLYWTERSVSKCCCPIGRKSI